MIRFRTVALVVCSASTLGGCSVATRTLPSAATTPNAGCDDSVSIADMSRFGTGAPPIRCRPWVIGTAVQGYVWEAPRPRAIVLLQHGFAEYAQRYVHRYNALIPHLLDAGFTVYAIDMPGHGRSPGWRGSVDVNQAARHHLAARARLRDQPLPVFLFGHSLGGLVTATSVVRDTTNVRGVVLTSPLLLQRKGAFLRGLAYAIAAVVPGAPLIPVGRLYISSLPEENRLANTDPLIYHGDITALVAATTLRVSRANVKHYPRWRVPVLVIHGSADNATDPEGSKRFHARIASSDKSLVIIEEGRHELLNDVARDQVLRSILDWLRARAGS